MLKVQSFTFNPFQENTYLIIAPGGSCIIIDPGCYDRSEQQILRQFIEEHQLKPVRLINTHAHIDHVLGNDFIYQTYQLTPELHRADLPTLAAIPQYAGAYGLNYTPSPEPQQLLEHGDTIQLEGCDIHVRFAPGHAPGHIMLFNENDYWLIAGDVLFQRSIGRTDLPGGDYDTLIQSIKEQCFTLPDETKVYCGHGPDTTIGEEKRYNPFCGAVAS